MAVGWCGVLVCVEGVREAFSYWLKVNVSAHGG